MSDILPNEVLLSIIGKISDPKSLLMSSLISKSVASILSERHYLLIRLPWNIRFTDAVFPRLTSLLHRFDGVQSLRLEVPCTCRQCRYADMLSNNFKWKAKIGCQFEIFSYLSLDLAEASKHPPTNEYKPGEEMVENLWDYSQENLVRYSYHEMYESRRMAISMHELALWLISHHPNLRNVEIVDSENHGGLLFNDEAIFNVRTTLVNDTLANVLSSSIKFTHFVVWYESKMKLRLSKTVVENVRLVICTYKKSEIQNNEIDGDIPFVSMQPDNFEIDAALSGRFGCDQDDVFAETMTQLLAEHVLKAMVYA